MFLALNGANVESVKYHENTNGVCKWVLVKDYPVYKKVSASERLPCD